MISCRYCPFYVAGRPPFYGVCVGSIPFASLDLREGAACPFDFDEGRICGSELSSILNGKDVKSLLYFAAASDGFRSPYFFDERKLRDFVDEWNKAHCSIYGVLLDADRHTLHTIKIGEVSA